MPIHTMKSRWGVELDAEPDDLVNIRAKINGGIRSTDALFVSKMNDLYVLRTGRWDRAGTASEAAQLATDDIALIRGCVDLLDGCAAIDVGTIFEFGEGGGFINQVRDTTVKVRVLKNPQKWESPETFEALFRKAEANDGLRNALSDLSADPNWYEVYKSLEALKAFYAKEEALLRAFPSEAQEIQRMRRTANSFRHTKGAYSPIQNPMALSEAIALLKKLILGAAQREEASKPSAAALPVSGFGVPDLTYPPEVVVGLEKIILEPMKVAGL